MKVLQQSSFCALKQFWDCVLGTQRWFSACFVHSKADREASHGLAVENFLSFIRYATFFLE